MENNEYQTTPYGKYEYSTQETSRKKEPTAFSIEEQYFNLSFKERMKIHNKRMKLKIKTKSQEFKAIAKVKNEKFRAKSKEIREKMLEKKRKINQKIHSKIEVHKAQEKQRQQHKILQNQYTVDILPTEPSKFCSECGVQVSFSGKFCPGCGALH